LRSLEAGVRVTEVTLGMIPWALFKTRLADALTSCLDRIDYRIMRDMARIPT